MGKRAPAHVVDFWARARARTVLGGGGGEGGRWSPVLSVVGVVEEEGAEFIVGYGKRGEREREGGRGEAESVRVRAAPESSGKGGSVSLSLFFEKRSGGVSLFQNASCAPCYRARALFDAATSHSSARSA